MAFCKISEFVRVQFSVGKVQKMEFSGRNGLSEPLWAEIDRYPGMKSAKKEMMGVFGGLSRSSGYRRLQ